MGSVDPPIPLSNHFLFISNEGCIDICTGSFQDYEDTKAGLSLTDTFGRKHTYLRISLNEICNLRCE
jgi:hypothetical protein